MKSKIFDGLTPYSFRVDLPNNSQSTAEIKEFFDHYNVVKYFGNPETGQETEKEHYQMIIWMNEKTGKERTKMRNWWRGKVPTKKGGGVSLTLAKNEIKLFGYCRKDEKNDVFTNVSKKIYDVVEKNDCIKDKKVKNAEKLQNLIGGISQNLSKSCYLVKLEEAYFSVYNKTCLRRNFYLQELRKAGYMNSWNVIATVFPHGIEGANYINDEWQESPCDNTVNDTYWNPDAQVPTTASYDHPLIQNEKIYRKISERKIKRNKKKGLKQNNILFSVDE